MSCDVMHITSDDGYQAVYIEGELADHGHSIDWMDVIAQLGCNTYHCEANEDWLEKEMSFPSSIQEVKFNDS